LPNFYTTINVNPNRIQYFVYPGFYTETCVPRFEGGDWDKRAHNDDLPSCSTDEKRGICSIEEYELYKSIRSRYVEKTDWKDTEYYSLAIQTIQEGGCWKRCNTEEELLKYLSDLDEIYASIKQDGYKSAKDLGNHISQEVTVSIGRNGEIFMDDGRHRLFMSKILGIQEIPVWVLVRHKKWQKYRKSATQSQLEPPRDQFNHPDLGDIQ